MCALSLSLKALYNRTSTMSSMPFNAEILSATARLSLDVSDTNTNEGRPGAGRATPMLDTLRDVGTHGAGTVTRWDTATQRFATGGGWWPTHLMPLLANTDSTGAMTPGRSMAE